MRAASTLQLLLCASLCASLAAPRAAQAQQPGAAPDTPAASDAARTEDDSADPFSALARRRYYEESKLSLPRMMMYNALPGLGNIHADDTFAGVIWMATFGLGAIILGYGLVTDQTAERWIGAGVLGVAYGGALFTTPDAVRAYNRALRIQYGLERADGLRVARPRSGGLGLSWTVRF